MKNRAIQHKVADGAQRLASGSHQKIGLHHPKIDGLYAKGTRASELIPGIRRLFSRSFVFSAHTWATLALALPVIRGLGMRDHQQRGSALEHAIHAAAQSFRVERSKALVENNEARPLQQRTRYVKAAALAVRELPASFTYHLQ